MDKESKILLIIFSLLLISSVGFTIYKFGIKKAYLISGFATCDPQIESCFYYPCEEGDTSCNPNEIEYYKKVEKKAFNIERDGGISDRQKRKLVDYIMSLHNDDEDLKEQKIAQLDEMSFHEADDLLCSISQWQ